MDMMRALAIPALFPGSPAQAAEFTTPTINRKTPISSWKAVRDFRMVKQQLDYSC